MIVIEANPSHVRFLSNFGSSSFIYAYQCTLPLEELKRYIHAAFSESSILEEINGSLAKYFICQDSNMNPRGYAKLIVSPAPPSIDSASCIELQRLYVDSDYRGVGAGKILESHAESYAADRNMRDIWLRVWEGNIVAQRIYRSWGFATVGKELYRVGADQRTVLLMRKTLVGRKSPPRKFQSTCLVAGDSVRRGFFLKSSHRHIFI